MAPMYKPTYNDHSYASSPSSSNHSSPQRQLVNPTAYANQIDAFSPPTNGLTHTPYHSSNIALSPALVPNHSIGNNTTSSSSVRPPTGSLVDAANPVKPLTASSSLAKSLPSVNQIAGDSSLPVQCDSKVNRKHFENPQHQQPAHARQQTLDNFSPHAASNPPDHDDPSPNAPPRAPAQSTTTTTTTGSTCFEETPRPQPLVANIIDATSVTSSPISYPQDTDISQQNPGIQHSPGEDDLIRGSPLAVDDILVEDLETLSLVTAAKVELEERSVISNNGDDIELASSSTTTTCTNSNTSCTITSTSSSNGTNTGNVALATLGGNMESSTQSPVAIGNGEIDDESSTPLHSSSSSFQNNHSDQKVDDVLEENSSACSTTATTVGASPTTATTTATTSTTTATITAVKVEVNRFENTPKSQQSLQSIAVAEEEQEAQTEEKEQKTIEPQPQQQQQQARVPLHSTVEHLDSEFSNLSKKKRDRIINRNNQRLVYTYID